MQKQTFNQVVVHCTDKNKSVRADVLHQTDTYMKVVLVGSSVVLHLKREDSKKQYIGHAHGMEFTSTGKFLD